MQPIRRVLSSGATGRVSKTKILPSSSGPPIDSESSGVIRPLINYSSKFYDTKGPAIEEIDLTELKPSLGEISSRTGFEELCAFSKINAPNPSIYVPGAPPLLKSVNLPVSLTKSRQTLHNDYTHSNEMEWAFFHALSVMKPSFNFESVDVVVYRQRLTDMLNVIKVDGHVGGDVNLGFCMIYHTLFIGLPPATKNDSLFFINSQKDTHGYGSAAEKAFTTPEPSLKDVTNHYRVICYSFGGLKFVVRFQVDAHLPLNQSSCSSAQTINDISASFVKETKSNIKKEINTRSLQVISDGSIIPSSALVEIRSHRRHEREPVLERVLPQMWFGRIPHLALVPYDRGTVESVELLRVANHLHSWEMENQEALRMLASLIAELREIALQGKGKVFKAICNRRDFEPKLRIYEAGNRSLSLPPDKFIKQFWR